MTVAIFTNNKSKKYLDFLNSLNFPLRFVDVVINESIIREFSGSHPVISFIALVEDDTAIYDIDIRYAYTEKVVTQNLIDHGWTEDTFKVRTYKSSPSRYKLILYICKDGIIPKPNKLSHQVPKQFNLGIYWKDIYHKYIPINEIDLSELGFADSIALESSKLAKTIKDKLPLLTIVTVVFNGEYLLEQTIQSVINQTYNNIEYIIIDGNSKDKTIDIIQKYEKEISFWISEPDLGLFDAMNKAFKYAKGEFINFMNVGDLFFSNSAIEMLDFGNLRSSVCGTNIFFSQELPGLIYSQTDEKLHGNHQSLFMSREEYTSFRFDIEYKYTADTHLWIYLLSNHENPISYQNKMISISRFGGISTSSKHLIPRMMEHLSYDKNKVLTLLRFMPKIVLSLFFKESFLEYFYFKLNSSSRD